MGPDRRRSGMTLIEVLVALGIFLVILSFMVPALLSTTTANTRNEQAGTAVRIATTTLEDYRAKLGSVTLPLTGTVSSTVTDRGVAYDVLTTFCPSDAPTGMTCSTNARYIRVDVSRVGTRIYRAESYFTQLN